MVTNVKGQPVADVIGGMTDLSVIIDSVNMNRLGANPASLNRVLGFTSPEQGRDYDAVGVAHAEVLSADTQGNAVKKIIPWGVLAALVVVYYFIARNA